jgi:hypothetical protein
VASTSVPDVLIHDVSIVDDPSACMNVCPEKVTAALATAAVSKEAARIECFNFIYMCVMVWVAFNDVLRRFTYATMNKRHWHLQNSEKNTHPCLDVKFFALIFAIFCARFT